MPQTLAPRVGYFVRGPYVRYRTAGIRFNLYLAKTSTALRGGNTWLCAL